MVHEILHSLKQGVDDVDGSLAVKFDMAKAYDQVEWSFLLNVMENLGCHPTYCGWIHECITTVSNNVLLNGSPYGYIKPK